MAKWEIDEIFEIALTAAIFIVDGSFFAYNLELYVCFRVFHFFRQKIGVSVNSRGEVESTSPRALEEIWTLWPIGLKVIMLSFDNSVSHTIMGVNA